MTSFRADYAPLSHARAEWGEIATLPWDEEIFGFAVADLKLPATIGPSMAEVTEFQNALQDFCQRTGAELISVRFDPVDHALVRVFSAAAFIPVDLSLEASSARLRPELMPKPRFGIRKATEQDTSAILSIARNAFQFGRYHTDPVFPRELADKRYQLWVENALYRGTPEDHLFVLGSESQVLGFYHAVLRDGVADLRLAAGDPKMAVGLGAALYSETLLALQGMGAKRYTTRISAPNTAIVNLYASFGFRFSNPEQIMHWHSPSARHLR